MKRLTALLAASVIAAAGFVSVAAAQPPAAPPAACPAQFASFFGPLQHDSTLGQFIAGQAQSLTPFGRNDVSGFAQTDPNACFA